MISSIVERLVQWSILLDNQLRDEVAMVVSELVRWSVMSWLHMEPRDFVKNAYMMYRINTQHMSVGLVVWLHRIMMEIRTSCILAPILPFIYVRLVEIRRTSQKSIYPMHINYLHRSYRRSMLFLDWLPSRGATQYRRLLWNAPKTPLLFAFPFAAPLKDPSLIWGYHTDCHKSLS